MKPLLPLLLSLTLLCAGCGAVSSAAASSGMSGAAASEAPPASSVVPEASSAPGDSGLVDSYTLNTPFTAGDRALTVRLHGSIDHCIGYERCGVYKMEILEGETVLQTLLIKDAIDAAYAAMGMDNFGNEDRTDYFTVESGLSLEDLDFDGYPDLRLIWQLGTVNADYLCYLWDPDAARFRYAFELVGYDLTVDAENRLLITEARDGCGFYYTDSYRYDNAAGALLHIGQSVENFRLEDGVEPDDALVFIWDYLPNVSTDLKYATADNFTGQVIYDSENARLRFGTLKKLQKAQDQLGQEGYRLLIWDAYRPVEAQYRLWELCPDPAYVADPSKGFSGHSRGNTVDVTLVTLDGGDVEMPSGFDEFSPLADRDYSDVSDAARENAERLEKAMTDAGFQGYSKEWWHYSDTTDYPVIQ